MFIAFKYSVILKMHIRHIISSGIQGSPCQPVSTTPDAQLIPLLHVHSFILGTWVILSDFIGHRSFIQGNLQSEEDYYPYLGRRRRRRRGYMIFLLLYCFPTLTSKYPKGRFVALRFIFSRFCMFCALPGQDIR